MALNTLKCNHVDTNGLEGLNTEDPVAVKLSWLENAHIHDEYMAKCKALTGSAVKGLK